MSISFSELTRTFLGLADFLRWATLRYSGVLLLSFMNWKYHKMHVFQFIRLLMSSNYEKFLDKNVNRCIHIEILYTYQVCGRPPQNLQSSFLKYFINAYINQAEQMIVFEQQQSITIPVSNKRNTKLAHVPISN